jgi:two-component system sensor histidine kinase RegB
MGICAYLAYGTFTRLGGDVQLFHRDGGGTCTRIIIPLKYLTIDEAEYGKHFSVIQD